MSTCVRCVLTIQRVDLKDLCESILALQLDATALKSIDLGLEVEAVQALGHEWLLRKLLCNLVDNAVKYTPAGGSVTIRCGPVAEVSSAAFLEVVDSGPGIAPHERGKALERFYKVQGTVGEGNGLGLAIADEIARVHTTQLALSDFQDHATSPHGLRVSLTLQLENPHLTA